MQKATPRPAQFLARYKNVCQKKEKYTSSTSPTNSTSQSFASKTASNSNGLKIQDNSSFFSRDTLFSGKARAYKPLSIQGVVGQRSITDQELRSSQNSVALRSSLVCEHNRSGIALKPEHLDASQYRL